MRILRRYLLWQHTLPFVFAVTALTSFELLRQIARRLEGLLGKGLPWTVILEFFALTIPFLVAITLSMSVLVAVLYTVSQMAGDREVTALRAGGVSIGQIVRPLLVAATGVAVVSFLFNDFVLPRTNHRLRNLMTDIYRTKPTFSLKEHVINEVQRGRTSLRAVSIDQATYRMRDVTLYSMEDARLNRIIYADSGRLAFAPNQEDLQLLLWDGAIHEFDRIDTRTFQQTAFGHQVILLRGVGSEFVRRDASDFRSDREMGICQLEEIVRTARHEAAVAERRAQAGELNGLRSLVGLPEVMPDTAVPEELPSLYCDVLSRLGSWLLPPPLEAQEPATPRQDTTRRWTPPDLREPDAMVRRPRAPDEGAAEAGTGLLERFNRPAQRAYVTGTLPRARLAEVRVLRDRLRSARLRAASYEAETQKKYSIPAACIVFVLVGVPLGIRFPRGGMGLVIGAGMGIFSVYYVGLIAGETLADRLIVPPFLAMWMANLLMAAAGAAGLWWVRRAGTAPRRRAGPRLRRGPRVAHR